MVDAGSVFGSLAGLPHFPMSFTSISADFGLSIVTGAFFVPLMNFEREREVTAGTYYVTGMVA